VYTVDSVYFLLVYDDPTEDRMVDSWIRGAESWMRFKPGDDGVSLIWPTGANSQFGTTGCAASCHPTPSLDLYEGGHFPNEGTDDIWYWRAGLTDPLQMADDHVARAATAQRLPDAANDYAMPNFTDSGDSEPMRMAGGENGGLDATQYLWAPSSVAFQADGINPVTGVPWIAGDMVPGWLLQSITGARADVRAIGRYGNGRWVVEFARALNTGDANDVQFNVDNDYRFAIAIHDRQRKFSRAEYLALPSAPLPSHYGAVLLELMFH
jgi:hypothetical protein